MRLNLESLHLLSIVRMLGSCVDLEFFEDLATKAVVRDHPADRTLDEKLGTA